jgi:hypothetical protein
MAKICVQAEVSGIQLGNIGADLALALHPGQPVALFIRPVSYSAGRENSVEWLF